MILNKIEDPRSNLEKARRLELVAFAQRHGLTEITEAMPAPLIRKVLRSKNLTNIVVHHKPLGSVGDTAAPNTTSVENGITIDAEDDLERQFLQQTGKPSPSAKPVSAMGINDLRAECKRLGIKLGRTDNMVSMKQKIEGHGK